MAFKIAWSREGRESDAILTDPFATLDDACKALDKNCAESPEQKWRKKSVMRFERKLPDCVMFLQVVDAETGAAVLPPASASTVDDFRREYKAALYRQVEKNPEEYAYGPEEVPRVAERMLRAMAQGEASIGPAAKSAARKCGIRPTIRDVKAFLSTGSGAAT